MWYCAVLVLAVVNGFPQFQQQIPNGEIVPHPCDPTQIWPGVGHIAEAGGGVRNPFGQDFDTNGRIWNSCLCNHDSDGDGRTNGEELGDPNCIWTVGDTPEFTTGLSHPGVCEPTTDPKCVRLNQAFGELCGPVVLECSSECGVKTLDIKLDPPTDVSSGTSYYCMTTTLPSDDEYHLIGFEPLIENPEVVHHIVLFGCPVVVDPERLASYSTPVSGCFMGLEECLASIIGWQIGVPGSCFPAQVGLPIGLDGFINVVLQVHYENPLGLTGITDSSGLRLYYTSNKRTYGSGALVTGVIMNIPPGQPYYEVTGGCGPYCTSQWGHSINVFSVTFHMHFLGVAARIEFFRGENKIGEMIENNFDYNRPEMLMFEPPVEVQPGDSIKVTCYYDTTSQPGFTHWGFATTDEMCFASLQIYPRLNQTSAACVGFTDLPVCGPVGDGILAYGNCSNVLEYWYSPQFQAALAPIAAACNLLTCTANCQAVIDVINTHPCSNKELFELYQLSTLTLDNPTLRGIVMLLAPCMTPPIEDDGSGSGDGGCQLPQTPGPTQDPNCPF